MKSTLSRVNGRSHRTISQKAKCSECKQVYTHFKFISLDGKCFKCCGVDEQDEQALIKFIAENK